MNIEPYSINKPVQKKSFLPKKKEEEVYDEDKEILRTLQLLKIDLDCVHQKLDYVTEEALIDAYIYEMQSLNLKYKYYINLCKERGLVN